MTKSLLVLDDEPADAKRYYEILRRELAKVDGSTWNIEYIDNPDAIDLRLQAKPAADLVFVDYMWKVPTGNADGSTRLMPDGPRHVRAVRTAMPDSTIIMVTRQPTLPQALQTESFDSGADRAYPFNDCFHDIAKTAQQLLDLKPRRHTAPFFHIEATQDVYCEVFLTDIVKSSQVNQDEQKDRLNSVVSALGSAFDTGDKTAEMKYQFTGDGFLVALLAPPPMLAFHTAIEFTASCPIATRTLLHAGTALLVDMDNGNESQVIGYALNDASHLLGAVDADGLYLSLPYFEGVLGGAAGSPKHLKYQPLSVNAKSGPSQLVKVTGH